MFKKILMWSIYFGLVGLLILGAVIRTEAKTESAGSLGEARSRNQDLEPVGESGGGGERDNREGQASGYSGTGRGRNQSSSAAAEELHLAEAEDHDLVPLTGTVTGMDAESLWVLTEQDHTQEVTGRAWRFILEGGLEFTIGDQVLLRGFFEDGEYEVSYLENLTTGSFLQVREDSGRPLWSGGAGR